MNKKKAKRIVYKIEDFVSAVERVFMVLLMLYGCYGFYDTLQVYNAAQAKSTLTYKPKTGQLLNQELTNNIAWLTLDDSSVDFPIMQGKTNEDYLNTDPYGNYSLSGSIFLDSRNSSDFSDSYNLVYGHHMSDNAMFGALDQWKEEKFYNSHKTGTLTTTNAIYKLEVIGIQEIDASEDNVFQPTTVELSESIDFINTTLNTNSEHILALSTCKQPESTLRTVLFCNMELVYEGESKITKDEPEEIGTRVGNKVYSDVKPIKTKETFIDLLLSKLF